MRSINSDFQFPVNFHKFCDKKLIEKIHLSKFISYARFFLIIENRSLSIGSRRQRQLSIC